MVATWISIDVYMNMNSIDAHKPKAQVPTAQNLKLYDAPPINNN